MTLGADAYNQAATYWPSPIQGGFGGLVFGAPQNILVRWEDRVELFTDKDGVEQRSNAVVFTLNHLETGGYLLKGTSAAADPTTLDDSLEIKRSDSIPDLSNLEQTNMVYL